MEKKEEWSRRAEEINVLLKRFLPKAEGLQRTVMEAMEYSVMAGGKRLRPMLLFETYKMFGGTEEEEAAPFMAAIEFIHTYSLVHDDLPAMDNDSYRRGKLTTHAKFGEAAGILAGDALLNYAFEVMAAAVVNAGDGKDRAAQAMRIIAEKAGIYGMIGGQAVDIEQSGKPLMEETLTYINKRKTAALLEACMMAGAALSGAGEKERESLEQIAEKAGLAFQIKDDLLDVLADEALLGKPLHSDERNGKQTYAALYGTERAGKEAEALIKEALALFDALPAKNPLLRELLLSFVNREH